jgi:hypothetical protein
MFQVLLPAEFREQHRRIVLEFARRGHEFARDEWRQAIVAFDLLKNAAVLTDRGLLPFPVIYRQHVEEPYADDFIEALYLAERVDVASVSQWATVARDIGTLGTGGRYVAPGCAHCSRKWRVDRG